MFDELLENSPDAERELRVCELTSVILSFLASPCRPNRQAVTDAARRLSPTLAEKVDDRLDRLLQGRSETWEELHADVIAQYRFLLLWLGLNRPDLFTESLEQRYRLRLAG